MTKNAKSVSKKDVKETKVADSGKIGDRQRLLARIAGDVAAGVMAAPSLSESASSADGVATIAVDIAEAILQKIGV